MQTIYNSDNYCVVVFPDAPNGAGFEIMDKQLKREIYIGGDVARAFHSKVRELMESEPDQEDVDAFLTQFDESARAGRVLNMRRIVRKVLNALLSSRAIA
jgi:hypothetical protein